MNNVHYVRTDAGRSSVGYLAVFAVLVFGALAAWWGLSVMGVLGNTDPTEVTGDSPGDDVGEVNDGQPVWLQGTGRELPPRLAIDDREPPSHLMYPWIWDYVDDDWNLEIFRDGSGDGVTYLSDIQVMFLVSPEDIYFRLFAGLRTDFHLEVLQWDPQARRAWLAREGRSGMTPVVEFDLVEGTVKEDWGGNAIPGANSVGYGVGNIYPLGLQNDGRELWVAENQVGLVTGVFWRESGATFRRSLATDEIRRQAVRGYATDHGIDAWIDLDSGTAVYRAADRVEEALRDEVWLMHDLLRDDIRVVSPQIPAGADCRPYADVSSGGQFEGDRIVALCRVGGSATTVYLDPTGASAPS